MRRGWLSRIDRALSGTRPAWIIASTILLLLLWGTHGRFELLSLVWPAYKGPGSNPGTRPSLVPGIPWDHELISFAAGFAILVVVPAILIKAVYGQRLSDYGLGLPPRGRRAFSLLVFVGLVAVLAIPFWYGARTPGMHRVYPLYRGFPGAAGFAAYELAYLLFFVATDFIFRGYLLFGLSSPGGTAREGGDPYPRGLRVVAQAMLVQMLAHALWHLGKPLPELWGTPIWGFVAGALALACRSIWPIALAHWALNIVIDVSSLAVSP